MEKPSSSSRFKTLIREYFPQYWLRMKSGLLKLLRKFPSAMKRNKKKKKKKQKRAALFDSFKVHYNWCSSHVLVSLSSHVYYDASWNSVIPMTDYVQMHEEEEELELWRYLQWLEEKGNDRASTTTTSSINDEMKDGNSCLEKESRCT